MSDYVELIPVNEMTNVGGYEKGTRFAGEQDANGAWQQRVMIKGAGVVSAGNTTYAPLGAGGVFLGVGEDVRNYSTIIISCSPDKASATDGLEFQFSPDNVNWKTTDTYTIAANACKIYTVQPAGPYFRVKYTNGAQEQSAFLLCVQCKMFGGVDRSHRVGDDLSGQDDADLVKAILSAERPGNAGIYTNIQATNGGNLKVSVEETNGASFDTLLNIARTNNLDGKTARTVYILGSRSQGWSSTSILGDACDYLDTSQALMNTPTSGQTLYVVSTSASDASAGTGARTVRIVYLDANGVEQVTTATLNGTTPVSLGTGFTAIQWIETATVGTNEVAVGNIAITSTNGAATVATTFELIRAGGNRSLSGRYKIPAGYDGYLLRWSYAAISTTMDTRIRADVFADDRTLCAGVYHFQDRVFVPSNTSGDSELDYLKCPAGSTIKISSIPGLAPAGNKLDCGFSLLLVAQ